MMTGGPQDGFASALFNGHVTHARLKPKRHALAYDVVSLLLDLDELAALDARLRLFSVGRLNLFAFRPQDRGDRSGRPLREQVEAAMRGAGLEPDGGPIRLLTMPRILGFAFNPLSVYFCYAWDGTLAAILWEVDNTFGERHGYMIPAGAPDARGRIVQTSAKAFYVSPFMDMELRYVFRVGPPAETLEILIEAHDGEGELLRARHLARRVELTDAALLRAFLSTPLQMLRVLGGIHWEALKIWLKGIKLRSRPPPPETAVSFGRPELRPDPDSRG